MKTRFEDFEVHIPKADGSGIAETVKVTVPVRWDEELQQWLMTADAHEIIDNTKARHMGLLLPAQFRELRERYGYSQREIGELFQVGEKSWTLWETGKRRPSRSINLLIRALYDGEISLNYLLKRAGKPPKQEIFEILSDEVLRTWFMKFFKNFEWPSTTQSGQARVLFSCNLAQSKTEVHRHWAIFSSRHRQAINQPFHLPPIRAAQPQSIALSSSRRKSDIPTES